MKNGYKIQKNNENGFTLLEILAALAIMGVLVVVMIPFFTNYAVFTSKAEENVDAINLAEKVMYEVVEDYPLQSYISSASIANCDTTPNLLPSRNGLPKNISGDKVYEVKGLLCSRPGKQRGGENINLYQLKIELWNEQTMVTETFTYIK
ncbi:type II secretion system protein [Pontibacillus salipaludis]|uniref:type II secretion system protein n=1 Tax=Pontibacillus salipaludis TaxID=1697394 RepID=UPI0031E6BF1F